MALIPAFTTLNHTDNLINKIEDSVKKTTDGILSNPIINGKVLSGVTLKANTTTTVNHLLDRALQGWFIVSMKSPSIVWETKRDNSAIYLNYIQLNSAGVALSGGITQTPTNAIITLEQSTSITIDLVVF